MRFAIRLAVRSLLRTPGFTAAAALTLALGIGATTAIFSVVNAVLLRPLPYSEPDRLVGVWFSFPGLGLPQAGLSDGTYFLYAKENRVFESVGAYSEDAANLTGGAEPERVSTSLATASLFQTLKVVPRLGRVFTEAEDRPHQPKVALMAEGMWRRKFGADPKVVGRTIQVDGVSYEILGIMPSTFRFPNERTQLWMPIAFDPANLQVGGFNYNAIARLKPGVTTTAAVADLERTMRRLPEIYPEVAKGIATSDMIERAHPHMLVHPMRDDVVGDVARVLWVILGTIGFVLLVACANVANLFLVRADARQRELAVRAALGAGRSDSVRRFVTEGIVLAVAGGAIGLALAAVGLKLLVQFGGTNIPRLSEISIDATTLSVAALVSVIVALACSAFPVLRFARRDLSPLLREGGRSATGGRERQRARQLLVVSQVALALVLLTASGLLARSFWELRAVRPGFEPSQRLTFRIALPGATYAKREQISAFYERLVDRLAALPSVTSVGATQKLPLTAEGENRSVMWIEGRELGKGELPPVLLQLSVTSDYFKAAGIPIIAGRGLARPNGDQAVTEAVISQSIAKRAFNDPSGRSALGKRVRRSPDANWYTIVGVVGDVRVASLDKPTEDVAYFPVLGHSGQWEYTPNTMSLVIRTAVEPRALAAAAQREVHALDASLPIFNLRALDEVVQVSMARTSFTMLLLGIAAGVAILLGVIGIYGVVSYTVSLRTREIGVRIALGARPTQVGGMVARQGAMMAAAGIAAGLVGALLLTRFLRALLYGVSPTDPITIAGAAALLLASAFLASWLPARRAARVDPMSALRAE